MNEIKHIPYPIHRGLSINPNTNPNTNKSNSRAHLPGILWWHINSTTSTQKQLNSNQCSNTTSIFYLSAPPPSPAKLRGVCLIISQKVNSGTVFQLSFVNFLRSLYSLDVE